MTSPTPSEYTWPKFSPSTCAALHNKLVQRARTSIPDHQNLPALHRNLFTLSDAPTTHPDDPSTDIHEYLGEPLTEFLSLIDHVPSDPGRSIQSTFLPFADPPNLHTLWRFSEADLDNRYNHAVLLYQDTFSHNTGGLLFDAATELVCWLRLPGFPKEDDLVPLEVVLRKWCQMWEVGKIWRDLEAPEQVRFRRWCEWELEETLKAWAKLLDAIETRMPGDSVGDAKSQSGHLSGADDDDTYGLVDASLLTRYRYTSFLIDFLTLARRSRRKPDLQIAPGITSFTSSSFESLYNPESPNSVRQQTIKNRAMENDEVQPLLIFPSPAVIPVRPDAARRNESNVDDAGQFGLFLLDRRAGLYSQPDLDFASSVSFITASGCSEHFQHRRRGCPWLARRRSSSLREILEFWTVGVETGVWEVDEGGVKGGMEWYEEFGRIADGSMKTLDDGREVSLQLDWMFSGSF
ncbi:MAG: hypothetical protein M1817_006885 [Caeruleum heppii]|nr:MAG: hypothetical protein M1817_006885 [Caeruleum heppii]